jgi:hypothetical protein
MESQLHLANTDVTPITGPLSIDSEAYCSSNTVSGTYSVYTNYAK